MTPKPAMNHGARLRYTCVSGLDKSATPTRRRSIQSKMPTETAIPRMWAPTNSAKPYSDSCIAIASAVVSSHSQISSSVIGRLPRARRSFEQDEGARRHREPEPQREADETEHARALLRLRGGSRKAVVDAELPRCGDEQDGHLGLEEAIRGDRGRAAGE